MKLNKKGFGVAEMAIVILLIGILAAAVIVGFLGIKKNATDHVKDEATKSIEIINQTKHAYPTILSGDKNGLLIDSGEYEVYELGGYSITNNTLNNKNCSLYVKEGGTLFVSGDGTLSTNPSWINGGNGYGFYNYGHMELSDLKMKAGSGGKAYVFWCDGTDSKTYLNNVVCEGNGACFYVGSKADVFISGPNSVVKISSSSYTSRYLFYVLGEVTIDDGSYTMKQTNNGYAWLPGGTVTINGGYFYGTSRGGFFVSNGGTLEITGGEFSVSNGKFFPFLKDESQNIYPTGKITITGGIFISNSALSIAAYNDPDYKDKQIVEIKGGYFQQKPTVGIAPGYHVASTKKTIKCRDGVSRSFYVVEKKPPETNQE